MDAMPDNAVISSGFTIRDAFMDALHTHALFRSQRGRIRSYAETGGDHHEQLKLVWQDVVDEEYILTSVHAAVSGMQRVDTRKWEIGESALQCFNAIWQLGQVVGTRSDDIWDYFCTRITERAQGSGR